MPRWLPSVAVVFGSGNSGVERKNVSPSEYVSLPCELMIKEKLVLKLVTFPNFLFQRCNGSGYMTRPHLFTASGVSWINVPEILALPLRIKDFWLFILLKLSVLNFIVAQGFMRKRKMVIIKTKYWISSFCAWKTMAGSGRVRVF